MNKEVVDVHPRLSRSAPENDSALLAMSSRRKLASRGVSEMRCLINEIVAYIANNNVTKSINFTAP